MSKKTETEQPLFLGYDSKHIFPSQNGCFITTNGIIIFILVISAIILARYLQF